MDQENREAEIGQWFKKRAFLGTWQVVEVVGPSSSEGTVPVKVIAECGIEANADRILADHRLAAVAREALEDIRKTAYRGNSSATLTLKTVQLKLDRALRSLTEGDQAAGEEKKGTGE